MYVDYFKRDLNPQSLSHEMSTWPFSRRAIQYMCVSVCHVASAKSLSKAALENV